ncbi:MAG TPA: hypothetical protein DD415_07125, partial [Clostridiales bacterium]|nr:hypothetical protein [Clostridiales bacterium]
MKSITKRLATVGITAAYALTLFYGAHLFTGKKVSAETEDYVKTIASTYFHDNLKITDKDNNEQDYTLAKKFYKALEEMNETGDFRDGNVEYSLTEKGIVTSDEIKKWVIDGDITIPKAFSAARDAFLTDHPEIFYIDFYKMTISAGRKNGVYSAFIDSGREANIYIDNGFTSAIEVNKAINMMNAEVKKIADEAEDYAAAETYGTAKDILKARYVNTYLANSIEYDFGALNDYLETGVSSASMINTSFGGLVNKKAVCGGISRAYKVILDRLGIPCIIVNGYSKAKDSKGEFTRGTTGHTWNYVYLENPVLEAEEEGLQEPQAAAYALSDEQTEGSSWYAFDVTWNVTNKNKSRYINMGSVSLNTDHIIDGFISSSGYELKYPELALYDYGCKTNSNGLVRSMTYQQDGDALDDYGNPTMNYVEKISYNGKSAMKLLDEDNLRIIFRSADLESEDGSLRWSVWIDLATFYRTILMDYQITEFDNGVQTTVKMNTGCLYTQFAVIDAAPDINYNPLFANSGIEGIPNMYYSYDFKAEEKDIGDHISVISDVFENKAYGTYVPPPYASNSALVTQFNIISDSMVAPDSKLMDVKYAKEYTITYDEPLHILDKSKDIGIAFTTKHSKSNIEQYAKFVPLESGKMVELVDEYTLKFKFMPSLMYEHNMELYTFSFTNVGSNKIRYKKDGTPYTSDKAPNTVTLGFERTYMACPACFNYDGRLYVDCCAQPTLLSNSDLSEVNFEDENGNLYSENERSQMLLVVDKVSQDTQDAMLNDMESNSAINVTKDDIKKSETYDIDLQICGKYATIPNGSYVKIALGFPEGYGPEDEGVTFKLFHYKHDKAGNYLGVEEIPCVVTKLGIVATVTSFSPYMVAVVPEEKASEGKTVIANITGRGGKLSNADGAVKTIKTGENCTYDFKPDDGYMIYSVTLNGEDITSKVSADGKLTLTYSELASNNDIEVKYIANEAAQRIEEKDIEVVDPVKVYVAVEDQPDRVPDILKPDKPVDPNPVDPNPVDPNPVDPNPVDPNPVDP